MRRPPRYASVTPSKTSSPRKKEIVAERGVATATGINEPEAVETFMAKAIATGVAADPDEGLRAWLAEHVYDPMLAAVRSTTKRHVFKRKQKDVTWYSVSIDGSTAPTVTIFFHDLADALAARDEADEILYDEEQDQERRAFRDVDEERGPCWWLTLTDRGVSTAADRHKTAVAR